MATLAAGFAVAAAAWAYLFGPWKEGFWGRAAVAGAAIGVYAGVVQRDRWSELLRPTLADVAVGIAGAVVLYAVFRAADRALRAVMPALATQVESLYTTRTASARGRLPVPAVLLLVGACEELFWRGLFQDRAGFAVALACYAAVHLWERKAVLVLAAVVGGAFWGAMFAWRGTLVAPILSHVLWDLAVVVWFPFAEPAETA